jgi:hypothetical protein
MASGSLIHKRMAMLGSLFDQGRAHRRAAGKGKAFRRAPCVDGSPGGGRKIYSTLEIYAFMVDPVEASAAYALRVARG